MELALILLFSLGLICGSFLNVVGLRWNSGLGLKGRSFCPVCRKKLTWTELVPVISFIIQGGKCRGCRSRISWQYPFVEILTGLVFASLYLALTRTLDVGAISFWVAYALYLSVFMIYIVILIYDWRHMIIPDGLVYASIIPAGFLHLYLGDFGWLDWLAGPIIYLFFFLIWAVSRGRAMGLGDAKLGLSIGLLLGGYLGFSAIVLAFWIGTVLTLGYMLITKLSSNHPLSSGVKKLTMKSEVPFGPFMVLGAWASLCLNLDLLHVLSL